MEKTTKLDSFDRKILQLLQQNAGLSNQEIAESIGLSASPCSRRIKHLEDSGVIEARVSRLNRKALNLDLMVILLIRMDKHTPERFEAFQEKVKRLPEVIECFLITGQDADYQLKVVVPDMDHYQRVLLQDITTIEGVAGVRSSFVLQQIVDSTAYPLDYV